MSAIVIAIPARDEGERIGACLVAIAGQDGVNLAAVTVVVLVNNDGTGTAAVVREAAQSLPLRVVCVERTFAPQAAHAGSARREAMALAAAAAPDDAMLVSTDADCVAAPGWLAGLRAALAGEVAAVAGEVRADWSELSRLPADALRIGALEWRYQALVAEAEALIDPRPGDPWPRHAQRCGANIAVRKGWHDAVGGIPAIPTGEDRAFLAAIERRDGLVRHAVGPMVTASARLVGRAKGGMADTLRARHAGQPALDTGLERAGPFLCRMKLRAEARAAWRAGRLSEWTHAQGFRTRLARQSLRHFGAAWQLLESREPVLTRHPLRADELEASIAALEHALSSLRSEAMRDAA